MAIDPSQLPADITQATTDQTYTGFGSQLNFGNVTQLEQQAGDMERAALSGYGTGIDPQLATEALQTGSSAPISYAMSQSDPALRSVALSQPIGQSQFNQKGIPTPTNLFANPYSFDAGQYQQYVQQQKANQINNSFESMSEAPMANLGWYNHILNGDNATIKKWQSFLADRGFYTGANGQGKGEVNGYNTQAFQDAMKQWSLAYFAPAAMFSRDPQELQGARTFLSSLGFNVDSISQQITGNPSGHTQVIDDWLMALGPDGNKVDRLNNFADHFGADALPDQLNQLRGDNMFSSIGNFLGHIPGVGNLLGTTPDQLDSKLTDAEKEALAPSLQNAHNQSGFMGFLGDVFSMPSKALVTSALFFGHAFNGDVENPFDANSAIRKQADTFVADPVKELFGEQFAKNNPWLATIANVAINIADDPMTFIPFLGEIGGAAKITEAGGQLTKLEKATNGLLSHRLGSLRLDYIKPTSVIKSLKEGDPKRIISGALDPISQSQSEIARLFTRAQIGSGMARDILGEAADTPEAQAKIDQILKLGRSGKTEDVLNFLRDKKNGYAHHMFDMSYLLNRHEYSKVLSNFERLQSNKAIHLWHTQNMMDVSNLVNLETHPSDALAGMRDAASVVGMDTGEIASFEDKFWHSSGLQRKQAWEDYAKALKDAGDQKWAKISHNGESGIKGLDAWRSQSRGGGFRYKAGDTLLYDVEHDPSKTAVEKSWHAQEYHFTKDSPFGVPKEELNAHMDELRGHLQTLEAEWQNQLEGHARDLMGDQVGIVTEDAKRQALKDPGLMQTKLTIQNQQQGIVEEMQSYAKTHEAKGAEQLRPAIVMPTQTYQWARIPFTASEAMAYGHTVLRKSEVIQHALGLNSALRAWKTAILSKPSTLMRMVFGDETSRFHINLILNDPSTALQYFRNQLTTHGKSLDEIAKQMDPSMLMDLHGLLNGSQIGQFVAKDPGEAGYKEALAHLINNHYSQTEGFHKYIQEAEHAFSLGNDPHEAGIRAIGDWLRGDSTQAGIMRESRNLPKEDSPQLRDLARTMGESIKGFTNYDLSRVDRRKVWDMVKNGRADMEQLTDLERRFGAAAMEGEYVLPRVQARPDVMIDSKGKLTKTLDAYHQWANKRINRARARGFVFKMESERKRIDKFYRDPATGLLPSGWDDNTIAHMARHSATAWVKKNTYQGARSAAGSELRSVAPFWGATANADKFYLRTLAEHPEVLVPFAQGELAITQAQQGGGVHVPLPGANFVAENLAHSLPVVGQMLGRFHLASGDAFTFDPFNSLFLTREGLGGFMPGMGPVFNVGMSALGGVDPTISNFFGSLPGASYIQQGTPVLPWLEEIASGALMMSGHQGIEAPFIGRQSGYYQKQADEKLQQLEANWQQNGRQGPAPTIEDAYRDLGVERTAVGVAGFAAPLGMAGEDTRKNAIMNAEQSWDPGFTKQDKEAFFAQNSDVADYFRYIDPTTPTQSVDGGVSKSDILARSPWVLDYATGVGASTLPGRTTVADTAKQYKLDVQLGNIRTLSPTEYLIKMRQNEETNQAWNIFDRLQANYQGWLQQSGNATQSAAAKAWRKANYDPVVQALVKDYPDWGNTFIKQTSTSEAGLEFASRPFYTLSTWEVLPQNPALETKATVLWRAALQRRDQAVAALTQVIAGHGSQAEKDMVIQGLAQQLDSLAAQDPKFASQLARYRYSSLNDLINFQAQQGADLQAGYPVG